mmetsp:Transcript_23659/g.73310  ORF Transcript_23659/g.73310 Transcript_23659/m.73310 type:complete len:290 (+) Transcript_23659:608-1477(+)
MVARDGLLQRTVVLVDVFDGELRRLHFDEGRRVPLVDLAVLVLAERGATFVYVAEQRFEGATVLRSLTFEFSHLRAAAFTCTTHGRDTSTLQVRTKERGHFCNLLSAKFRKFAFSVCNGSTFLVDIAQQRVQCDAVFNRAALGVLRIQGATCFCDTRLQRSRLLVKGTHVCFGRLQRSARCLRLACTASLGVLLHSACTILQLARQLFRRPTRLFSCRDLLCMLLTRFRCCFISCGENTDVFLAALCDCIQTHFVLIDLSLHVTDSLIHFRRMAGRGLCVCQSLSCSTQ